MARVSLLAGKPAPTLVLKLKFQVTTSNRLRQNSSNRRLKYIIHKIIWTYPWIWRLCLFLVASPQHGCHKLRVWAKHSWRANCHFGMTNFLARKAGSRTVTWTCPLKTPAVHGMMMTGDIFVGPFLTWLWGDLPGPLRRATQRPLPAVPQVRSPGPPFGVSLTSPSLGILNHNKVIVSNWFADQGPESPRLSPARAKLGTSLSAFGIGRMAFPAVDAHLARSLGDGWRREATLRKRGFDFCRQTLHFGHGFGFCGTTVMVVLAAVPVVRVGTSRLGRRGLASESLQTTFPMNQHVCVCFRGEVAGVARSRFPSHFIMDLDKALSSFSRSFKDSMTSFITGLPYSWPPQTQSLRILLPVPWCGCSSRLGWRLTKIIPVLYQNYPHICFNFPPVFLHTNWCRKCIRKNQSCPPF